MKAIRSNPFVQKRKYLIGIDEAGRGPLAGPISVGVFAVKSKDTLKLFKGVKDSKQLSEKQREEWFATIKTHSRKGTVCYAVSFSGAATIDIKGLTRATRMAMGRLLKGLKLIDLRRSIHECFSMARSMRLRSM